jgi:hypothetical protein
MNRYISLAVLVIVSLTLAGCGLVGGEPHFDGSTRPSAAGQFTASVTSDPAVPPVNVMHTWVLHLSNGDGSPVEDAQISVDGDMPAHGHGLPTQPQVSRHLGNGRYLVEGMQFQMGGDWYVEFAITVAGASDTVRFDFRL